MPVSGAYEGGGHWRSHAIVPNFCVKQDFSRKELFFDINSNLLIPISLKPDAL